MFRNYLPNNKGLAFSGRSLLAPISVKYRPIRSHQTNLTLLGERVRIPALRGYSPKREKPEQSSDVVPPGLFTTHANNPISIGNIRIRGYHKQLSSY